MSNDNKLNWRNIPLSKQVTPTEVLRNRPYGNQYGERWSLKNDVPHVKSIFAGRSMNKKGSN